MNRFKISNNGEIIFDMDDDVKEFLDIYGDHRLQLVAAVLADPTIDPYSCDFGGHNFIRTLQFPITNNYVMRKINERVSSKMEIINVNLYEECCRTYHIKIIAKFKTLLD